MPVFEYYEPETNQVIELVRTIEERDKPVVLKRKTVPSRLGIVAGGTPEPTMSQKILKDYYKLEQEQGSRFKSGFSKSQLKRVHEGR